MDRQEQITNWLTGEMTPEEASEFERRMQEDESLRAEVEESRLALEAAGAWFEGEAPGVEQVDKLPAPQVATGKVVQHPSRSIAPVSLWRWVAAAAIFAGGFFMGQQAQLPSGAVGEGMRPEETSIQRPVLERESIAAPENTPALEGEVQVALQDVEQDEVEPVRYATEKDGRVIVETTLTGSGAQAFWVVDGSFKLAQNGNSESGL
jgi:hypothetical protein